MSLTDDVMLSSYTSRVSIDGEAILPPLVTKQRRSECVTYRHQAVLAESRMRARRKTRQLAQVQDALDTASETSPRSRIFPVVGDNGSVPAQSGGSPENVAITSAEDRCAPRIPMPNVWPVQQCSAQSPTVQHSVVPSAELQESSSSSGDATMGITHSYMFQSSDSSEYQTTVIARDDSSDLKQVARILRQEKLLNDAGVPIEHTFSQMADIGPLANHSHILPGEPLPQRGQISSEHSHSLAQHGQSFTQSADTNVPHGEADNSDEVSEASQAGQAGQVGQADMLESEKVRRTSGESGDSAPRSKGLSRALGLVKDVVGSHERLHRDDVGVDDMSSTLSSDYHMYSTASTDINQYMKVPLSSTESTCTERASTNATDTTYVDEQQGDLDGARASRASRVSEHGRAGKHEHLKRYLRHLSSQPPTTSQSESSVNDPEIDQSVGMYDLQHVSSGPNHPSHGANQGHGLPSRQSDIEMTDEDLLLYQSQQFDERRRLLEMQQRLQIEKLMEEQRMEKERLQQEMLQQEERLRKAQQALYSSGHRLVPQSVTVHDDELTDSDVEESMHYMPFDRVLLRGSNRYHVDNRSPYQDPSLLARQGHDSDPDTPSRAIAASRRRRAVVKVPEKALDPAMKPKYERISAAVKGYLTRRLLRTEKVRSLIKTIKDTAEFAISFHSETGMRGGIHSMQDVTLQERVIAQLRAALLEVHEIFFDLSIKDRMSIIDQSRELEREKRYRGGSLKRSVSDTRGKKLSVATQRALERKRQARLLEQSIPNNDTTPVLDTAPSVHRSVPSDSHHQHYQQQQPHRLRTMDIRALRPIQGQSSPVKPTKPGLNKDDRPHTAPAKSNKISSNRHEEPTITRGKTSAPSVKKTSSKSSSKSPAVGVPTTRLKPASNTASSNPINKQSNKPTLTTVPVSSNNWRR